MGALPLKKSKFNRDRDVHLLKVYLDVIDYLDTRNMFDIDPAIAEEVKGDLKEIIVENILTERGDQNESK